MQSNWLICYSLGAKFLVGGHTQFGGWTQLWWVGPHLWWVGPGPPGPPAGYGPVSRVFYLLQIKRMSIFNRVQDYLDIALQN